MGVMITAVRTVHWKNGVWVTEGGYEYNLVLIAALLALAEGARGAVGGRGAGTRVGSLLGRACWHSEPPGRTPPSRSPSAARLRHPAKAAAPARRLGGPTPARRTPSSRRTRDRGPSWSRTSGRPSRRPPAARSDRQASSTRRRSLPRPPRPARLPRPSRPRARGMPRTSAWRCMSQRLAVIPPSTRRIAGAAPAAPSASAMSRTRKQSASSSARTRWAGVVWAVIPVKTARASARHHGAPRPLSAGRNRTPPVSATDAASASDRSGAARSPRLVAHSRADPAEKTPPSRA